MNTATTRRRIYAVLAGMTLTMACGSNVIGPENQLEVANATDNFEFQVTALTNVSQTLTYTWETTGAVANVDQSSSVSAGNATLIIQDADGAEVYRRDLNADGTFETDPGAPGAWRIEVSLSGVDGTVNFRVQRRP